MVAPFSAALGTLEKGAFTKTPVQTQFGWHVILLEDARESPAPTLEEVRPKLEAAAQQEALATHITQLRDQANIEVVRGEQAEGGDAEGGKTAQ